MISFRQLEKGFRELGLNQRQPVILHGAKDEFSTIHGGIDTLVGALVANSYSIITPAFTYQSMVIPEQGPPNNGITYGTGRQANTMVEPYHPFMEADDALGSFPRVFSRMPGVMRSSHPILSFFGIHAEEYLTCQTLRDPLGVLQAAMSSDGMVLLVNTQHSANTTIHLGEKLAGRRTFIRWALLPESLVECPNFPGCSSGFDAITGPIASISGSMNLAGLEISACSMRDLVSVVQKLISADPNALLCQRPDCERCNAIRHA